MHSSTSLSTGLSERDKLSSFRWYSWGVSVRLPQSTLGDFQQ